MPGPGLAGVGDLPLQLDVYHGPPRALDGFKPSLAWEGTRKGGWDGGTAQGFKVEKEGLLISD